LKWRRSAQKIEDHQGHVTRGRVDDPAVGGLAQAIDKLADADGYQQHGHRQEYPASPAKSRFVHSTNIPQSRYDIVTAGWSARNNRRAAPNFDRLPQFHDSR